MEEFDGDGWSHVHHAAYSGYQKSITRFVRSNEDQLELLTKDGKRSTPLLLACSSGALETVRFLVDLGADLAATDRDGFGVVEVSSCAGHLSILEYFLEIKSSQVNVYKLLVKGLDSSRGIYLQTSCLKSLTQLSSLDRLEAIADSGAIEAVIKVLCSPGSEEEGIVNSLFFLEKIIGSRDAQELIRKSNGVNALVRQLNASVKEVYSLSVKLLTELARGNRDTVDKIAKNKGIESLLKILERAPQGDDVQLAVLNTLGLFCKVTRDIQDVFAKTPDSFKILVKLLKECKKRRVVACLARTVALLVEENEQNQNTFVSEDGVSSLIPVLMRSKPQETQMAAVAAIKSIAHQGSRTNQELLECHGCVKILTKMLREGSRKEEVRQLVGEALWAIAGNQTSRKFTIAKSIGIGILIEFLKASSTNLNFIGSEALVVLAEDIFSKQEEIVAASATQFLACLIGKPSTPEHTVLSIFQVFCALCIQVGFRPHVKGQQAILMDGGVKFLVRYLIHSHKPLIQSQAAYTLSCIALGNQETNTVITNLFEFSRLIDLLSEEASDVRLTAGAALALFAFNNTQNQKSMAVPGALHYSMFQSFFESDDDLSLAKVAFQVVVLSRVFPDEDQATTSATGIKLLVNLLEKGNEEIQALCSNFIAGLSHTRPGIPAAFVSIGTIHILARLLMSPSEKVRSCSAVALGYLSLDKSGQRQLLNICRSEPDLYNTLCRYAKKVKLSQEFVERWKHYRRLWCLPPIKHTVCLINQTEKDEIFTTESHLNENVDGESDDESLSESSERILPFLLS